MSRGAAAFAFKLRVSPHPTRSVSSGLVVGDPPRGGFPQLNAQVMISCWAVEPPVPAVKPT